MEGNMSDWNEATLLAWLQKHRSNFGNKTMNKILATAKEEEMTGAMLIASSRDALKETFDISQMKADILYALVKKKKIAHLQKHFSPPPNAARPSGHNDRNNNSNRRWRGGNNNYSAPMNVPFVLNINAKGNRLKLKEKVTAQTLVSTVQQMYLDQEVAALSDQDELRRKALGVQLISSGVGLDPRKTLGFYNIKNGKNLVTVRFTADGGTAATADELSEYRERTLEQCKNRASTRPDCITFDDADETALMPCGHAIAPDTMYAYIKSIFLKNEPTIQICCPVRSPPCNAEWDYQLCTAVADMSDAEYVRWTAIRDRRMAAARDEKECPHCHALCKRKEDVKIFRMCCRQCSNSDWCWECGEPWNHSGLFLCGNANCRVVTELNLELQNAKTIKQAVAAGQHKDVSSYTFMENCPVSRACPRCLTVMFHTAACKHMKCIGCLQHFCFVCLALEDSSGKYSCGSHGDPCTIKPRQKYT